MSEATRFVIVGMPRTGSTLLLTSLQQHELVTAHSELFHHEILDRAVRHAILRDHAKVYYPSADVDAIDFLKAQVFNPDEMAKAGAVGFKLFGGRYRCEGAERLLHRMPMAIGPFKALHIVRNPLESLISYNVALATHRWVEENDSPPLAEEVRVQVPVDEAERWIAEVEAADEAFRKAFSADARLEVDYHALERRYDETMAEVFAYLGVGDWPVKPAIRKQRKLPPKEAVENWDALEAALGDGPNARYLAVSED